MGLNVDAELVESISTKRLDAHLNRAYLAAIITLILWGGTPIANKVAVAYMGGASVGVLRSLLAGVIAVAIASSMKLPIPSTTRERLVLLVSGVTSFAIWPILFSIGVVNTTASHAALILTLLPIFTVLIESIVRRRLPNRRWWLGALIALSGGAVLIRFLTPISTGHGASAVGDAIIVVGCIVCAIGYVAGGSLSVKIGALATTLWGLSFALIVLVPAMFFLRDSSEWSLVPIGGWLAIAWLTLLSSLAGYMLWFYALGRGGIGRISSLQLGSPVVSLAAASVVLAEPLTPQLLIVSAVIIAGTYVAQRNVREKQ